VSIVFELLGGAVALSAIKIAQSAQGLSGFSDYINSSRAMIIIFGILLSIIVAFISGALIQFISRSIFSFNYIKSLKRYGAIWGGIALALITNFILVKGAKNASFITEEQVLWIKENATLLLFYIFIVSAVILQILLFFKINIFKIVVLIGTFALAMAFAANDLVNFIGVPIAGFHAYNTAIGADSPLTVTMEALGKEVTTAPYMLIIAGVIMVLTLWISKKARTVSQTELSLGFQGENEEKYESVFLSRAIVRMFIAFFSFISSIIPLSIRSAFNRRFDTTHYSSEADTGQRPSFDLLRASVNLMVASALISYATSFKLPLSTTYVTFMVSMGSSFADKAWGRESAVYRITGVLTVISGWFLTALIAFTFSCLTALFIYYTEIYGIITMLIVVGLIVWHNHRRHLERVRYSEKDTIFNLRKITDIRESVIITFEQMGLLIKEIRESLETTLNALYIQNGFALRKERKSTKCIQHWSNVISANVFKVIRLMEKDHIELSNGYGQTIRRLQKVVDGHRDAIMRSYVHVSNHHKGLLDVQIAELKQAQSLMLNILADVEYALANKDMDIRSKADKKLNQLRDLSEKFNKNQVERIRNDSSKTRLSILFYAFLGNFMMLSKQSIKLLEVFSITLSEASRYMVKFDLD
ncbi:MAG: inorganic phosphate transporter, partial [Calditrichaceae bacterium]|nr:inorganic phosphate transporter [Calditrichaceae bacterium]